MHSAKICAFFLLSVFFSMEFHSLSARAVRVDDDNEMAIGNSLNWIRSNETYMGLHTHPSNRRSSDGCTHAKALIPFLFSLTVQLFNNSYLCPLCHKDFHKYITISSNISTMRRFADYYRYVSSTLICLFVEAVFSLARTTAIWTSDSKWIMRWKNI